ncbi:MAG: hypothetical protein AUI36_01675 [Cyanobacteria bacterium 13_1_40CM_2_61_4]|nr:MAG: hypothetical protein AUI36_01675 [Cyanobacteria bacterium 13_1_40CM_2_61_4]
MQAGLASVGDRAFSFTLAAVATIASITFATVLAFMLRIAFGRRGLAHPRRQHFQVDQFVEIETGFGHECLLPQGENKTSALSNLVAQF